MENKHTQDDLKMLQALPLDVKIRKTELRIQELYEKFDGQVYVSRSGGKDSDVLGDIVKNYILMYHTFLLIPAWSMTV
jgi:3'-phosphoadenosine 5'-phosphosulfate sulfotransferase (PAPS reductase)/FAD synthetase